ncbi:MAG: restriction endonuclease subunit S [Lachnospiraceae bacterium]|nr:restriction endonuclease subunit S [Lachnospiraceae bacterium]
MVKKKESLTLEERLENALVPDWEQTYKVPSNWVWTTLDNVALYKKGPFGSSITKAMFVPQSNDTYKVYEQGNAIKKDKNYGSYYISKEKFEELKGFQVFNKDIIVSCAGTIGETFQLLEPFEKGIINQALMRIKIHEPINQKYYLMYFDESIQGDITKKAKGTAIKNIPPFSVLKNLPFPLPPLAEQQRIVDRIEKLFSKLEEAKEKAQIVLDSFENRKAAILHKAFTGELTKKWREENGVTMESWEETTLQGVCSQKITDGTHQTPTYTDKITGVPFISSKDVTKGYIDWTDIKYITEDLHEKLYARISPQLDDVLLAKNGTTGVAAIVETQNIFDIYVTLAVLRPNKEQIVPRYLLRIINSPICKKQFDEHLTGIGVPNLHLRDIKNIVIPLPSLFEQYEIVRIVDTIFNKEQNAKELANVIEKLDLMKKSILARAFRGELDTNNPEEESALVLLKEMLSKEKITEQKSNKKQKTIPNSISKQFKTDLEEQIYRVILENQNSTLNQILSWISSSKHLDAMEVITVLYENGLIEKKDDLYSTK